MKQKFQQVFQPGLLRSYQSRGERTGGGLRFACPQGQSSWDNAQLATRLEFFLRLSRADKVERQAIDAVGAPMSSPGCFRLSAAPFLFQGIVAPAGTGFGRKPLRADGSGGGLLG